jgi:RNA polymerase sigma-70 factor (ECF subfamily)
MCIVAELRVTSFAVLRPLVELPGAQMAVPGPRPAVHEALEHANSAYAGARISKPAPTATDRKIGAQIRSLRHTAGLTLRDLGQAAGVSLVQIQRYEAGTSRVSVSRLIAISDALGVRLSSLIGEPSFVTTAEAILLLHRNEIAAPPRALETTTDPTTPPAGVMSGDAIAIQQAEHGTAPEVAIPNQDDNSDGTDPGSQKVTDGHDRPAGPDPHFAVQLLTVLPSLRRQAMALTRHRADADDLLQTAMTNALGAQNSFHPGTDFRAWMSCILRNQFFSEIRRRRVVVDLDDAPVAMLSHKGGQEDSVLLQETRRHMDHLPTAQREALSMIAIQGLSYEEVSGHLGIPLGTVKARVFRARERLQHWMLGEAIDTGAARQPAMVAD